MKTINFSLLTCIFNCCLLSFSFADTQTAIHKIESDFFSSGGAVLIETPNYKVEDSAIDFNSKDLISTANYQLEGQIGLVSAPIPTISSITPGDYSRFYMDETPSFTVNAQDPDSDPVQYQLKVDGVVKVPYQDSNLFSYNLTPEDLGLHTLTFQVQDTNDGSASTVQSAYYCRRPTK